MKKQVLILTLIIALGAFFRLYGLNWDDGHYLHPDERLYVHEIHVPSSWKEFFSPDSPMNIKIFYYGPLPLYLYNFFNFIFPSTSFLLTSRTIAALFSVFTIPVLYLIGKRLYSSSLGLLSAFIFAVTPASIQHAHFNTTESFLVFFLSLILYYAILLILTKRLVFIPLLALLMSFSFAIKITALTFSIIPAVAILHLLLVTRRRQMLLLVSILSTLLATIVGIVLTPYYWIDFNTFYDQQSYMKGVILGTNKPPFVIIYEHTIPYIYPLFQVLPFTFGFIMLPLGIVGLIFLIILLFKSLKNKKTIMLNILFPRIYKRSELITIAVLFIAFPLIYYAWSGGWYSKFSRYYIVLLPFFSFYGAFIINRLNLYLKTVFMILIFINGILFFRIYLSPHTRITASEWIYQNIPNTATIAFEHWDDVIPLPLIQYPPRAANLKELPVYNLPDTKEKIASLADTLANSDYITLSSRRVYYSILRNKEKYPLTSSLYIHLFEGNLGFKLEKQFTNYPYFLSDDVADESFQTYDHPPVLIFKKYKVLTPKEIQARIETIP